MNWLRKTAGGMQPPGPVALDDNSPAACAAGDGALMAVTARNGAPVAVIAGADVVLHRLLLGETSVARRIGEARMRAVDLAAQPPEDLHVAVGPADADGASWVAITDRQRMAAHLAALTAAGHAPRHMVPAPLLLPDGGSATLGGLLLFRSGDNAGAVEPALAARLVPEAQQTALPFHLTPPVDTPLPVDLMQGEFSFRPRWWRDRGFRSKAALLVALALLLALAPALIGHRRTAEAIAGFDTGTVQVAHQVLGENAPADAAAAAAALTTARQQAEGAAIGARFTLLAREIERLPQAHLAAATFSDGQLHITLAGPADAINSLAPRLAAGPFTVERNGIDLRLGDRRTLMAQGGTPVVLARQRLVGAGADAAIVAALRKRPALSGPGQLAGHTRALLAAAGLGAAMVSETASGVAVTLPAVRSQTLLPLLADLEAAGARFTSLSVQPHDDNSLSASFGVTP